MFKIIVISILMVVLSACGGATNDASQVDEPIIIKFPHVVAPGTPKGQTASRFEQLVEERFPGRVDVEVYPSGQLMTDDDSLEALAFGEIQMIAISLSKFDRLTQAFQVFDLPFLFPDIRAVENFQASIEGKALLEALVDSGFLGLAFWHNGMKHFGAHRPLRLPDDAQGLRFRIMESDVLQAQMEAIGGNPQKMSYGEVYQALQTGAIDAQENTWSNIYSSKFHEVQPYFMLSNHGYVGYFVAVNEQFWETLPKDIRDGLKEIMAEVTEWGNARSIAINDESREKILATGRAEIIALTDQELREWRTAVQLVWEQFSDEIGADLIEAAQRSSN